MSAPIDREIVEMVERLGRCRFVSPLPPGPVARRELSDGMTVVVSLAGCSAAQIAEGERLAAKREERARRDATRRHRKP